MSASYFSTSRISPIAMAELIGTFCPWIGDQKLEISVPVGGLVEKDDRNLLNLLRFWLTSRDLVAWLKSVFECRQRWHPRCRQTRNNSYPFRRGTKRFVQEVPCSITRQILPYIRPFIYSRTVSVIEWLYHCDVSTKFYVALKPISV